MENEEEVRDEFICEVCHKLLYEPYVLQCGHYFCFECVNGNGGAFSDFIYCPKCQTMMTHMATEFGQIITVTKILYPKTYLERAAEIQGKTFDVGPLEMNTTESERLKAVREVLKCQACEKYLVRPVVKPCGHVFCEDCVTVRRNGCSICPVCETPNWMGRSNVCWSLNSFIEDMLPKPKPRNESKKWKDIKFLQNCYCLNCGACPIVGDCFVCEQCKLVCACCRDCYGLGPIPDPEFYPDHTGEHKFTVFPSESLKQKILCHAEKYPPESAVNVLRKFRRNSVVFCVNDSSKYVFSFEGLRFISVENDVFSLSGGEFHSVLKTK